MLLPQVSNLLPVDTILHPKRLESSSIHILKDKHCLFSHQDPMQDPLTYKAGIEIWYMKLVEGINESYCLCCEEAVWRIKLPAPISIMNTYKRCEFFTCNINIILLILRKHK